MKANEIKLSNLPNLFKHSLNWSCPNFIVVNKYCAFLVLLLEVILIKKKILLVLTIGLRSIVKEMSSFLSIIAILMQVAQTKANYTLIGKVHPT